MIKEKKLLPVAFIDAQVWVVELYAVKVFSPLVIDWSLPPKINIVSLIIWEQENIARTVPVEGEAQVLLKNL